MLLEITTMHVEAWRVMAESSSDVIATMENGLIIQYPAVCLVHSTLQCLVHSTLQTMKSIQRYRQTMKTIQRYSWVLHFLATRVDVAIVADRGPFGAVLVQLLLTHVCSLVNLAVVRV